MFGSYFKKAPKPDRFRETIKKPEVSFSIEWRDQSIRRLEELLKITQDQLVDKNKIIDALATVGRDREILREQLEETCRRKGIRDEENNRLRGEVDRLQSVNSELLEEIYSLHETIKQLKKGLARPRANEGGFPHP